MNAALDFLKNKFVSLFSSRIKVSSTLIDTEIDKRAAIRQKARLYHVKLGRYSYIGRNTLIQYAEIGNFCSISEGCNIGLPSHPTDMVSTSPVFLAGKNYLKKNFAYLPYDDCPTTYIGNDVWIGTGAKIKSGVHIGNGAIIAAGAIVTKNVDPFAIVGGVPAKLIRYRFDEQTIDALQKEKWWEWPESRIEENAEHFSEVSLFRGKYRQT